MRKEHGYYLINNTQYPGVTSILSQTRPEKDVLALQKWRKRLGSVAADKVSKEACQRGTKLHQDIESYLLTRELGCIDIDNWWENARDLVVYVGDHYTILGTERVVRSDKYCYAGTFDCLVTAQGSNVLLDWKTSAKPKQEQRIQDYYLQLSAYAFAIEEFVGTKIDRAAIVIFLPNSPPQLFKVTRSLLSIYFDTFLRRLNKFYAKA